MNSYKIAAAILLSLGTLSTPLNALLPPLYQTSQELRMILENERLGKALPDGEPILEIHKNEMGYEITTLHYHVQANIVYKSASRPGPAQFEVEFQKAIKVQPIGAEH